MKTLLDTRTYVLEQLTPHFGKQSVNIEKSILEYTKQHAKLKHIKELRWSDVNIRRYYLRKYRSIMFNIESLKTNVKSGKFDVNNIAFIHPWKLSPELWDPIIERQQQRYINSKLWEEDLVCDGILKCINEECNSMNTKYVELQTRGGDEPSTIFARCLECSTHWSLNGK